MIFITERVHDFKQSLVLGEQGEGIILDWFKNRNKTSEVLDVRGNPKYRADDIDFIIKDKNGSSRSIEVKTDSYKSGNFFYETVSAVETQSLGCMYKSKADYLVYYFINENKFYVIDFEEFNNWMSKLIAERNPYAKFKQFKNNRYDNSKYTSQGYTIPIVYVKENFKGKCWEFPVITLDETEDTKELN